MKGNGASRSRVIDESLWIERHNQICKLGTSVLGTVEELMES